MTGADCSLEFGVLVQYFPLFEYVRWGHSGWLLGFGFSSLSVPAADPMHVRMSDIHIPHKPISKHGGLFFCTLPKSQDMPEIRSHWR